MMKYPASCRVVNTILESDIDVLGPVPSFTSIWPNIVIEEIKQALLRPRREIATFGKYHDPAWETEHFSDSLITWKSSIDN